MIKQGSATTILSAASRIAGDLAADEDVILAGSFEGRIQTSRSVQITNTGSLRGEIDADSVTVLGSVTGPIRARERIELQPGAVVNGDVSAQKVRIHDDVVFNGHCCVTGSEAVRRQYLVPAVVQAFGPATSPEMLAGVQSAAEGLLRDFGFEVEVRADRAVPGAQVLRPIFRSRDAVAYSSLRERLGALETALQSASSPDSGRERRFGVLRRADKDTEPLQTTGAGGARSLLDALARLDNGAVMMGPVIVTRVQDERGANLSVRVRQDSLPPETVATGGVPEPSALLLSLQKMQMEIARDLGASIATRREA